MCVLCFLRCISAKEIIFYKSHEKEFVVCIECDAVKRLQNNGENCLSIDLSLRPNAKQYAINAVSDLEQKVLSYRN